MNNLSGNYPSAEVNNFTVDGTLSVLGASSLSTLSTSGLITGTYKDSNNVSRVGIGTDMFINTGATDEQKLLFDVKGAQTYNYRAIGSQNNYMVLHNGSSQNGTSGFLFYTSNLAMNARDVVFQITNFGLGTSGTIVATAFGGFKVSDPNSSPSSSTTTGALQVLGGTGMTGNCYVGGNIVSTGSITSNGVVISPTYAQSSGNYWAGAFTNSTVFSEYSMNISGNIVTITWPSVSATATGASLGTIFNAPTAIPSTYRPTSDRYQYVRVKDNGAFVPGELWLSTSGVMQFSKADGTNFTSATTVGFRSGSISFDRTL